MNRGRRLRHRVQYLLDPRVDRYVLEEVVLPALAARDEVNDVLFVGCDWYTRRYHERWAPLHVQTIDLDPEKASYGSPDHIQGSVTELDHHLGAETIDAVVLSGVIGFGLDRAEDCEAAIEQCRKVLRPGGWLVIGWNDVDDLRTAAPESLRALAAFDPTPLPPFPHPRYPTFSPARHTFDFYRRRAEG
ncbi:MAG: methyltransferase domain-containing protein [Acidimicrobiales bacterium]